MSEDRPDAPGPLGEGFNPHAHLTEEEKEAVWRSRDALKTEREAFLGLEHAPPCALGAWREIWKSGIAFVARGDIFNVNFGPEVHIQLRLADDLEAFVFEPGEELSGETALDGIGFEEDQRTLHVYGPWKSFSKDNV